ncbi:MAG: ATP-binding protein [Gemmatimonadaceae bacterium]
MSRSPFKFLDSYQKEDRDHFFGRERETAQLYNAVRASNFVLVYGASGTGKTSIINCGLANQFTDADWFPLFVRRGTDLNASLQQTLCGQMSEAARARLATAPVADQVRELYLEHYRPLYLIFDQFEELFILGDRQEQQTFYETVRQLLAASTTCKVLISIREEYIAALSAFEKVVPTLFDNRLRVERANDAALARVVMGTAVSAKITVTEPRTTVGQILDSIRDPRTGIDLANLQIYLDRLWRADLARQGTSTPATVTFDPPLVAAVGTLDRVLSVFLDEELAGIETALTQRGVRNARGVPLEVLFAFVTEEGTKRNLDLASLQAALPPNRALKEPDVQFCLQELERIRLLRTLET